MSCSETDMAPSGGPCKVCGEYPYCHRTKDHYYYGFFFGLLHPFLKRRLREEFKNRGGVVLDIYGKPMQ